MPQSAASPKSPADIVLWEGSYEDFLLEQDDSINELTQKFSTYGRGIDKIAVTRWLRRFESKHLPLALKLLKSVDYYNQGRVLMEFKELFNQLVQLEGPDLSNTLFASFGYPGESGDEMVYRFRLANRLDGADLNPNFLYLSDVGKYLDTKNLKFIFINDFVGTGKQAVETWENIAGLISEQNEVYLLVMAACQEGIDKIRQRTRLRVVANRTLAEESRVFSDKNSVFSAQERDILHKYCEIAGGFTEGYGDIQSLIIFHFRAPNNSIPILWCNNRRWKGLFVRNP